MSKEQMIKKVADDIIARIDETLLELEEELLQERINSDPKLQGKEISPELREQLLEEIRERCLSIEA